MAAKRKFYQFGATLAGDWWEVKLGQVMNQTTELNGWVVTGFDPKHPGLWVAANDHVIFVAGNESLWENLSIRFMSPKAAGKKD